MVTDITAYIKEFTFHEKRDLFNFGDSVDELVLAHLELQSLGTTLRDQSCEQAL